MYVTCIARAQTTHKPTKLMGRDKHELNEDIYSVQDIVKLSPDSPKGLKTRLNQTTTFKSPRFLHTKYMDLPLCEAHPVAYRASLAMHGLLVKEGQPRHT